MTGDELIQHRLKALEDIAVGARETERRVDTLTLSFANIERDLSELVGSVKALHKRLDDVVREDTYEKGREAGENSASTRTWKVVGWTVMATIAFGALVLALLTLVLK